MTYFRMGNPHYHRRAAVSRSCSRWEGVVPAGYGRQTLRGGVGVTPGKKQSGFDWCARRCAPGAGLWSQAARAISTG